jgi:hypothetical protein
MYISSREPLSLAVGVTPKRKLREFKGRETPSHLAILGMLPFDRIRKANRNNRAADLIFFSKALTQLER